MTVTKELNGAYDTVANAAGTGTALTPANPGRWPDPKLVGPVPLSVWPTSVPFNNVDGERLMATELVAGVYTIARQQEGSGLRNIQVGDQMALGWGAQEGRGALSVGNRNLLINAGFAFCQAIAPTGTVIGLPGGHGPDGWYAQAQNAAPTYSRFLGVTAPSKGPYFGLLTAGAASGRVAIEQVIPSWKTIPLRGEVVRFDIYVSATQAHNARVAILEWTGTADAVNKDTVGTWTSTTYTPSNFFTATTKNVLGVSGSVAVGGAGVPVLASIRGTVGASANNLIVIVWSEGSLNALSAVGYADAWFVPDTVSVPYIPRDRLLEYEECAQYYQKSYEPDTVPATATQLGADRIYSPFAAASDFIVKEALFSPRMWKIPSISYWDLAGNASKVTENTAGGGATNNVAPSIGPGNIASRKFDMTHDPAGNIVGLSYHWAADARL